jgi:hypothetical protein
MNILNAKAVTNDEPHYLLEGGGRAIFIHNDDTYEYDPTGVRGPELLNFKEGKEDATRQIESDKAWVESCSPAKKLETNKQAMVEVNQAEAGKHIATLFNAEYGTDAMRNKEANMQMLSAKLIRKEAKGTATTEESAQLDSMDVLLETIEEIREVENSKAAEINAVTSQAELDGITAINWSV